MATLTGKLSLIADFTYLKTTGLTDSQSRALVKAITTFTSGSGDDQVNAIWTDDRNISASANDDLDLAGVESDAFGDTLTFTKVKVIMVKADSTNTNDVVIGGAASNALANLFADTSDKIVIPPGGSFAITAPKDGWAVTAGTADILRIANSAGGTAVDYTIVIAGTV